MRTEHIRNKQDNKMLLVKDFYPYNTKTKLEYIGHITSAKDLVSKRHSHPVAEIMLLEKGKLQIEIAHENINMVENDIIIYNAGVEHFEKCDESGNISLFYMGINFTNPEISDNVIIPEEYPSSYKSGKYFENMITLFSLALKESRESSAYHYEIAQNIVKTLLLYIYRIVNDQSQAKLLLSSKKPIGDICAFIDEHFLEDISLDELAGKFYINKYYMSHLFSEQCGMTIVQYINSKRIEKAKELLEESNLSISRIYRECGFGNENYFCRLFRKYTGKTPSQYRYSKKPVF